MNGSAQIGSVDHQIDVGLVSPVGVPIDLCSQDDALEEERIDLALSQPVSQLASLGDQPVDSRSAARRMYLKMFENPSGQGAACLLVFNDRIQPRPQPMIS